MNSKFLRLMNLLIIGAILLAACAPSAPSFPARTVNVLVGSGKDQAELAAFFPPSIRVRTGDTVAFKLNSDDPHTVTFPGANPPPTFVMPAPGSPPPGPTTPPALIVNPDIANEVKPTGAYDGKAYVNSGFLTRVAEIIPDAPLKDSWSMTFDKPGVYQFMCMIHPFMQGVVEVVDKSVADVPPPEAITGQAQGMIGAFSKMQEGAKQAAAKGASEPGPNNTTIYFVQAGFVDLDTGNPATEVQDFAPKQVTLKPGDSVLWTSQGFHVITFNPKPPDPKWEGAKKQGDKTFYFLNFDVFGPSKPAGTFDPTKLYNSGPIGPGNDRAAWLLTFDKPGTYDYFCAIHKPLGMKGTIIVQPK